MVEVVSRGGTSASDGTWFERLYGETFGDAMAYARRLVGSIDADDVVQDAYLRLARYRPAGGEQIGIRFVMAVVKNVALDFQARKTRDSRQHRESLRHWREYSDTDGPQSGTSTGWAREQLAALPASHQEAFVLVEVLGLSESQAGLAMHLSRPVVGAKKRCAAEALRNKARRLDGLAPAASPASPKSVCRSALSFPRLAHGQSAA